MVNTNIRRMAVIGRFQPFHNGHLLLVRQILKESNEVLVVIGSAQLNYTFENPFTVGERILMIRAALIEGGVDLSKIIIIPIVDEEDNAVWFPKLVSMLPPFEVLYSGNKLVVTLASYIRYKMVRGDKWAHLVSKSVFDIIYSMGGIDRLKALAKHENRELQNE